MTDDLNIGAGVAAVAADIGDSRGLGDRRRPSANLSREQIVSATATCLAQYGYDGTTIRTLARMLGCAVGSIYRYFPDKRSLLLEVVQRPLRSIASSCGAARPVREGVELYLDVAMRNPAAYQLLFWLWSMQEQEADMPAAQLPPAVAEIVAGWAARLGSEGAAYGLWTRVHGVATLGDVRRLEALAADLEIHGDAGAAPPFRSRRPVAAAPSAPVARREDVCLL